MNDRTGTAADRARPELSIACTLTADELGAKRGDLLPGLIAGAVEREAVADGFRWRFEPADGLLAKIGMVLEEESRCCAFLDFQLQAGGGGAPIHLQVTGPPGTADFLLDLTERDARAPTTHRAP